MAGKDTPRATLVATWDYIGKSNTPHTLVIDTARGVVTLDAQELQPREMRHERSKTHLTPLEYTLLQFLARHVDAPASRETQLLHLYDDLTKRDARIGHVVICKLRKKLGDDSEEPQLIKTVWGRGHMMSTPTTYDLAKDVGEEKPDTVTEARQRPPHLQGPKGDVLVLQDLPDPGPAFRWVPRRKAEVVIAVDGGLITEREARERYQLSAGEFAEWRDHYKRFGIDGLRSTRVGTYAQAA